VNEALAALAALHASLARLLHGLTAEQWDAATPAEGWTVRDQVAHLADTDEVARDTIVDGPRTFKNAVSGHPDAESFTAEGCRRGRGLTTDELLRWWTSAAKGCREALAGSNARVAWGLGMSTLDFTRARIMEHWAHGLDISEAVAGPETIAPVLPQVARLSAATVPYALARAGIRRPAGHTLRFVLTARDESLELGDPDATDLVTGPIDAWCRLAVRRPRPGDRSSLSATGPLADLALTHARAYL
jgi:uncharacterized protein (TIGR03084 family)